jgi:Lrp/AsnC family leucine-responsive transcriptional regulator
MLDRYEREILSILQRDGRISNQELADKVGISASSCLRRMRALEEAGYISQYKAELNPKALGLGLMALVTISMDKHVPERFDEFDKAIKQIPNVIECLLITGQTADYQLKVVVPDMDTYQELLLKRINKIPGVAGVHSSFVLNTVIYRGPLPV